MKPTTKLFACLLIVVDFLLLHYIVSSIPLRFDLTQENIYTLSDGTKEILQKIEDPVTVDFYNSRSLGDLPPWFKTFADRVEQMLEQYERASGGSLELNVIDPKPDSPEEDRALAAGLNGQEITNGDRVFLGLVVSQGDAEKTIPFFNWDRETSLEYDISRAIYEAQLISKPRLGLLTSLPLQAAGGPTMPGQPPQEDQYFVEQLAANFEVVTIQSSDEELPENLDLLALVHPKDIGDALLFHIDQFALSGKPTFLALDPSSALEREQTQRAMMMGGMSPTAPSDLPKLLAAWGIEYDPAKVVLDPNISIAQPNFVQPAWMIFQDEKINRDLLPSSELGNVLVAEAGALSLSEDATASWEPILTTSEEAATIHATSLQFAAPDTLMGQSTPLETAATVAGMLTGQISTAFPDGPPADETPEPETQNPTPASEGEATIFIISDTDWLLDNFSIERINFLGIRQIRPLNDNTTLAANFTEYLGGSQDLIGIRSKGRTARAFDVVEAMEAEAQKDFQAQADAVEAQLEQINARLSELVQQQQGSGLIYATPEMQEVIEENQAQQVKLRAELRKIRRELRSGIESLGHTIGTINLVWAPLALLAFGLYFSRLRKRK